MVRLDLKCSMNVYRADGSSIKNITDQVVINAGGQPTEVRRFCVSVD